jgi:hypothetical protein
MGDNRSSFTPMPVVQTIKQFFSRPLGWVYFLVGLTAAALFFGAYARAYSPMFGLTRFLRVGKEYDDRGIAAFRTAPKYLDPAAPWGFDGQFYAELALDPLLRDPQLRIALDNPTYRSRRILLPWLAALGGWGRPFWTLNVYAALNPVFWGGFLLMMGVLFRPHGWAGLAGFAVLLMTCGIIESMHSSLTDFPGFVLLTLAMMAGGTGGAGLLALASLAREPNIVGLVGLWDYRPPWLAMVRRNIILGAIAGLPLVLWFSYVLSRFPPSVETLAGGNLSWPLQGIMGKLGEVSVAVGQGEIRWSHWYSELYDNRVLHALLTIVSVLTQCVFLLVHREWSNRIWRAGAIFIPYFLCIGFNSWEDHFTITRHALPITLAFNLVLAMSARRAWPVWFLLGNCFVPFGVHQFTFKELAAPNPPPEYRIAAAPDSTPFVRLRFDRGWADEEWIRNHTWRWALASHATLVVANPSSQPVSVSLSFLTKSISVRDLKVGVRGTEVWSTLYLQTNLPVATAPFLVPPGETIVSFDTTGGTVRPEAATDQRQLSFAVQDIALYLSAPPPAN